MGYIRCGHGVPYTTPCDLCEDVWFEHTVAPILHHGLVRLLQYQTRHFNKAKADYRKNTEKLIAHVECIMNRAAEKGG